VCLLRGTQWIYVQLGIIFVEKCLISVSEQTARWVGPVDDEVIGLKKRYRGRTLSIQARRQKELPIQIGKHIINHQQQEEIVWYDLPFLFPPAKKIRQSIFSLIKNPKINQIIREVIDQKKTIEDYKRELYAYFYSVLKKKFDASPEPIIEWVENWLQEQFGNMEGEIHTSGYVPPTVVKNIWVVLENLQTLWLHYEKDIQEHPFLRVEVDSPEYQEWEEILKQNGTYDDLLVKWLTDEQIEQYLILRVYHDKINPYDDTKYRLKMKGEDQDQKD